MDTSKIKRNQFLKELGFKGSALFALYCTGIACSISDVAPINIDTLSVDLNNSSNSNLLIEGGYIVKNGIVVANVSGTYIAATQICSHDNLRKVIFRNGEFYCTEHGARFNLNGKGLNNDGKKGLQIFTVSQQENILSIS